MDWKHCLFILGSSLCVFATQKTENIKVTTVPTTIRFDEGGQNGATNEDRLYLLTADQGKVISVDFTMFNIEDTAICSGDYVEIGEGHSPDGNLMWKKCGHTLPAAVTSKSNTFYILFHSGGSGRNSAFSVNVRSSP
ncbi:Cubilin [Clonorchis sinensis]|uniref:Cubilin n=1 Tax=Clonorchis sinensis TaxID=79923 RepID=A0A8T1M016_CLOSI|nr:Cubilin [Clonorchis sinensis]